MLHILQRIWGIALVSSGLLATTTSGATVNQQQPAGGSAAPDVQKLGPQIGDTVPDFTLPDQHGQVRTLSSLMGPQGLVLVFNRSADW